MAVKILTDQDADISCFYDAVKMKVFGPAIESFTYGGFCLGSLEVAEEFDQWLPKKIHFYTPDELHDRLDNFLAEKRAEADEPINLDDLPC